MYNVATLHTELASLVGWRKDNDPSATLNPMGDMLTASSGLFFNDEHPLLTTRNLASLAPDFSEYTYTAWAADTTYVKGDIATSGGNYYVSIANANLNNAVSSTTHWRQTTPFNEWLRNKTLGGITQAINDWINAKFDNRTAKNLLQRKTVLKSPGSEIELANNMRDYCGWYIVPTPQDGIVFTIDRIAIQMQDSASTVLNLYKNGGTTAVETLTITGDGTSDVIWSDAGWELEAGNFYYLAFDQSALESTPINSIANMDKTSWAWSRFPGILPYAEISAFTHAGPGQSGWSDVSGIVRNDTNYGLNMSVSARCDYSQFIIDQGSLFAHAICKRVAINFLRELSYNAEARINRNLENLDPLSIKIDLDGHPNGRKAGLSLEYDKVIQSITFDQKGISGECLPCKKRGIRIGAA